MIRLRLSLELDYEIAPPSCDFIFNIHAARTECQHVLQENLQISQNVATWVDTDPITRNRYLRLSGAPGPLTVSYNATVDLNHYVEQPGNIAEIPVSQLPTSVLGYIYPSRYCQSDRLLRLATREFGHWQQGYSRVQGIRDWVQQRIQFAQNTSNSNTSAVDTLLETVGVCRDFAHLMIALCRAVNIPARMASGMDYGADPVLGPPDFHAYVEVYLSDGISSRWFMFDPSGTAIPMGFVRFCTGRDAADIAFATIFGRINMMQPVISIQPVPNGRGELVTPQHVGYALSSDGP